MTTIKIKNKLKEKNKSIYWLHKCSGITYANLNKLANNKTTSIKWEVLEKICKALECSPNDIISIK